MSRIAAGLIALLATIAGAGADESLFYPCASCHWSDGSGSEAIGAPAIAGMDATYVERQLRNFRDGRRGVELSDLDGRQMSLVTASYTNEELASVASYVAALPPVTAQPVVQADAVAGRGLYARCAACHGTQAQGVSGLGTPALNLASDWYVARQTRNFRDGIRGTADGDSYGAQMRAAVIGLDDTDIDALAAYIATLAP